MTKQERRFIDTVWAYYETVGRHDLPWRKTKDPYRILVSEIMLQQTQVDRVIPKYQAFIQQFPTLKRLAVAPLGDVLRAWQGLRYNRRAKMLHTCAVEVVKMYRGVLPKEHDVLMKLPGIGHYTAGAVMAFAYEHAVPIIETNIRSVVIHHFFHDDTDVHDADILQIVARTLDHARVRAWYYALMDYGVYVKKTFGNPNSKSKHYTQQSPFVGSDRQIRGAIIRHLARGACTRKKLHSALPFDGVRIDAQLVRLTEEGMVVKRGTRYALP